MSTTFNALLDFIRDHYKIPDGPVPMHAPLFVANERKYVIDAIDSTYVSSVGRYVDRFEQLFREYTGASYAIATVNGTAALHISLVLAGVQKNDLVISQPLTFIATCNAISYLGAEPIFIDVDKETLGLSPSKLRAFLKESTRVSNDTCYHKSTGKRIAACVPMHTFGHPAKLEELVDLCREYKIPLIEDAAESIGSTYHNKHTGTYGLMGAFSFNGNKTITCGGGGMVVTNNERIGKLAKHLTTQARVTHPYEFVHDHVGYNYRLPNLNAAMACAQMEILDKFVASKRALAKKYKAFFANTEIEFIDEPSGTFSNFWLNSILLKDKEQRDAFLQFSNEKSVMTRPVWRLMNKLEMFKHCLAEELSVAVEIESRLVNLPSSARPEDLSS
jgi:aminotransferase in exopolysaccharide biosynthesis